MILTASLAALLAAAPPAYAKVFDDTKLHRIELQPASAADAAKLDVLPIEWAQAHVVIDGERAGLAGLRRKGSITGRPRTSLRIGFGKIVKNQRFRGLENLVLNYARLDPSKMREKLAYDVYAEAGCRVSRAAHAQVFLGKDLLGLYTIVEHVGDPFLDERFGGHRGDLFELVGAGDYFAEPLELGDAIAQPREHRDRLDRTRLHALVEAVRRGGEELERWFDVESYLPCLAAEVAVANLDGYAGVGHNFYLYDDPRRGKFVFIPWDLDRAFGQSVQAAKHEVIAWDVFSPAIRSKLLIARVLDDPRHRARYTEHLRAIATGPLSFRELNRRSLAIKQLIGRDAQLHEDVELGGGANVFASSFGLVPFARARAKSILEQLAGLGSGARLTHH